jgi:hypothetical protein
MNLLLVLRLFLDVYYLVADVSGRPVMLIFKGIKVKEECGGRDGCDRIQRRVWTVIGSRGKYRIHSGCLGVSR